MLIKFMVLQIHLIVFQFYLVQYFILFNLPDFFAYSLIAIGICKFVNIDIPSNFNKPYFQEYY